MVFLNKKNIAEVIHQMDIHLRKDLLIKDGIFQDKKLWENTYIKKQIDRRINNEMFTIENHIQAMVYSMLSAGITWQRIESGIDITTGRIKPIDEIFFNYNPDVLLNCNPEKLKNELKNIHCASQYTLKQMKALINVNINKLIEIEKHYGSIDDFYQQYIHKDKTLKTLVQVLSDMQSKNKFMQMGEALTSEYLRNVGYDIPKPDRHIRRILGSNHLGCSANEIVPGFEVFDIVSELADKMKKSVAEVDYILWSYCANGYGEICTINKPKCELCVANKYCINFKEK